MAPYIMEEYIKACKAGKRDYQARMMKGQLPTLQVLDEILPPKGSYSEVPLGLVQIPIDQIVGNQKRWKKQCIRRELYAYSQRKHRICI